jgi:hypothetical protein
VVKNVNSVIQQIDVNDQTTHKLLVALLEHVTILSGYYFMYFSPVPFLHFSTFYPSKSDKLLIDISAVTLFLNITAVPGNKAFQFI